MTQNNKTVGENKLDRLMRLMKVYQTQVGTQGEEVVVHLTPVSASLWMDEDRIYCGTIEKVIDFLESGELKRTLMVRG